MQEVESVSMCTCVGGFGGQPRLYIDIEPEVSCVGLAQARPNKSN